MSYNIGDYVILADEDVFNRNGYNTSFCRTLCEVISYTPDYDEYFLRVVSTNHTYHFENVVIDRKVTDKELENTFICDCCKTRQLSIEKIQFKKGKKICRRCLNNQSYYTKNNNMKNKQSKNGLMFGFEFECVPFSLEDKATIALSNYSLIPTDDGSLPSLGVEFKSPIFRSLRGLNNLFDFMNRHANLQHSSCGTHINVGHIAYGEEEQELVSDYQSSIFHPLYCIMRDNRSATEKICGRYFTSYARSYEDTDIYLGHGMFINIDHNDRIEFRISKFRNPKQFMHLTKMWGNMMIEIVKWAHDAEECKSAYNRRQSARKLGRKLVDIYQYNIENLPE